ncbi:cytochrome P450 [Athelia psychrophila]|uniref:Cytochrome P450 n=1 Tax=Athelia psychrophila TaxID=1759441 RepID=A0A166BMP2_9AGAM|nr:cytochrome P450 [Fibularhizoctonia sp. CBS 109695]
MIHTYPSWVFNYPPGPKPSWPFGNEIPSNRQWLKFDEWRRRYGDVVRITVMGQPAVILGSFKAANDLLDSRGTRSIYSDRPSAAMAGELVGWARGMGYSPYNNRFREFRRTFNHSIGPKACQRTEFMAMEETENKKFLRNVLDDPERFFEHARQSTGSLLLRLAYGYSVETKDDPFVKIAEDAMLGFSQASEPGAFWVDSFPLLKYVPSWVPGAGFKKVAYRMRQDLERLYSVPYDFVKSEMSKGTALPSFTSTFLEEKMETPDAKEEEFIKAACASLYSDGKPPPTPSSVTSFILAMTLNPAVQARAHAELDALIGKDVRLPTFTDRQYLPYVNAIVKEVLRWNPSVPLGLPHVCTEEDMYEGYQIDEGTTVWANIWSILHDELIYPEPSEFRPERYLGEDGQLRALERAEDPAQIAFGFGRRICPGMSLADNSVFLAVSTLLYIFNISKAKDADGEDITPAIEYDGFICHPQPFRCCIAPRSVELAALL